MITAKEANRLLKVTKSKKALDREYIEAQVIKAIWVMEQSHVFLEYLKRPTKRWVNRLTSLGYAVTVEEPRDDVVFTVKLTW